MPFPTNQDALFAAGYDYLRWENCPACGLCVEVWQTPGKREMSFDPMPSHESPATQHFKTCTPKEAQIGPRGSAVQDAEGRIRDGGADGTAGLSGSGSAPLHGTVVVPDGRFNAGSAGIKLFGVTDPNHNLLAAGWQDGTLVCQFKTAKWAYGPGVPEAEYLKLRNSPYAYRIFNTNIKDKFTATKFDGEDGRLRHD